MSTSTSFERRSTTTPVRISPAIGSCKRTLDFGQQGSHRVFGAVQLIIPTKDGGSSGITHTANGTSKELK
jgi:hypothetical protein